ncbi:MAG TPA: plastocyanin/azurin family copper-binding protein [Acidimicrobiia bacterium]|nr:plastocyanin/azurin family copper-binding protein [Acidimicrobiia bacterium]
MRRTFLLTTILVLALVPAVAGAGGGGSMSLCPAFSSGTTVSVLDSCFNGIAHNAPVGETLTVRNDGEIPHTVTAIDGSFDTGQLAPGETATLSFDEAGIYKVYCTLHGSVDGSGMAGLLIVGDPDPAFVAAPIDPEQIKSDVSAAVADGNQSLAAKVAGHERLLTGIMQGQTALSEKLDRLDSAAETPIVVSVPEAEGFTLLAVAAGLGVGLALAAMLAVLLRRRFDARQGLRQLPIEIAHVPAEAHEEPRILVS